MAVSAGAVGATPWWSRSRPASVCERGRAVARRASFERDDLGEADVGVGGEQVGGDRGECPGNLSVEVGLPRVLGLERVEDAERGLTEPERVPGHGALLG